jgi:formate dehydrogenase subunit delta
MKPEQLIRMANQIGVFFESMPDRTQAQHDLASHLKNFWEPRMRRAFLVLLNSPAGDAVSDIVRQAVQQHRALLD